ncbi:1-acyl-sn-glycerol-3-phosphate acyltransferase [Acinetobacter variabilis]|uniref:1-acyl-sn-glycerol-3-phosphate acyltransferase n=1 Tax=Acinetobacter variabilis TaxID=70346 RepID=UPI0021D05AD2|nr:1-acyl-sn-glycerol-3-phosphate acyltransferase [Acinetobacter variabilis]MCU4630616.1 1-acyl-sn-glycerol-3-phosphate acyltransferase [Acinetobacter variabilis]
MSTTRFPKLPPLVPSRGGKLIQILFKQLFLAQGWQLKGEFPNLPKAVAIISPHTSNIDAWLGFNALLGLDIQITIFGKDSLFRTPLKPILEWIGVVPVVRDTPQGHTRQIVDVINKTDRIWVGMAPEGSRKAPEKIRSGFYHIAKAAHLPIVMFSFDYDIKTIHILGVYHLTGDYEYDLEQIYKHYEGKFSDKNPDWVAKPLQKLLKKD